MKNVFIIVYLLFAEHAWAQNPKIKEQESLEKERSLRKENKIKSKSEFRVEEDEMVGQTLFRQEIYDENGFLVQVIEPQAEDSVRTIYQYNEKGFETMNTIIGLDLVPIQNSTEYDEAGRKTAGASASAEVRNYKFLYDKNDLLIRKEGYTMGDYETGEWSLVDIDSFFYDKSGNITEEISYYMGEEVWRERHYYDDKGRLIKTEGLRSENVELTEEYTYDEKGLPETHTSTDSDGTLEFIYEYEYFD
jgi:hypothetical protein